MACDAERPQPTQWPVDPWPGRSSERQATINYASARPASGSVGSGSDSSSAEVTAGRFRRSSSSHSFRASHARFCISHSLYSASTRGQSAKVLSRANVSRERRYAITTKARTSAVTGRRNHDFVPFDGSPRAKSGAMLPTMKSRARQPPDQKMWRGTAALNRSRFFGHVADLVHHAAAAPIAARYASRGVRWPWRSMSHSWL